MTTHGYCPNGHTAHNEMEVDGYWRCYQCGIRFLDLIPLDKPPMPKMPEPAPKAAQAAPEAKPEGPSPSSPPTPAPQGAEARDWKEEAYNQGVRALAAEAKVETLEAEINRLHLRLKLTEGAAKAMREGAAERLEAQRQPPAPASPGGLDHDLDCLHSAVEDTKPAGHSLVCPTQTFARGACNCQYEASLALYERDKAALARVRAALTAQPPGGLDLEAADDDETADLHMQWASDGDDLEGSFNSLHAYAKKLEARLAAAPPPRSLEARPLEEGRAPGREIFFRAEAKEGWVEIHFTFDGNRVGMRRVGMPYDWMAPVLADRINRPTAPLEEGKAAQPRSQEGGENAAR